MNWAELARWEWLLLLLLVLVAAVVELVAVRRLVKRDRERESP